MADGTDVEFTEFLVRMSDGTESTDVAGLALGLPIVHETGTPLT